MASNPRIHERREPFNPGLVVPEISDSRSAQVLDFPSSVAPESTEHYEAAKSIVVSASRAQKSAYLVFKRTFDIVGTVVLCAGLSPLLLVLSALVKMTSRGPVLFKHRRLGRDGKEFWCYKFRTMRVDAEQQLQEDATLRAQFEGNYKIKDDPRVTPLGRILRRTSLDEMPQFWNVLRGDMSLIGPRPIVPSELSKYGPYGHKLLSVSPGLSGLWQACGRSETSYETRVEMDMLYIDRMCVLLDIKLTVMTALTVFKKIGAY